MQRIPVQKHQILTNKGNIVAKGLTILAASLLAACAAIDEPADTRVNDAVKDYIEVAGLEQVDVIRPGNNQRIRDISDKYFLLSDGRDEYLIRYQQRCRLLEDPRTQPDIRYEGRRIRARFDTIRGCRIAAIYAVSEGQADELYEIK